MNPSTIVLVTLVLVWGSIVIEVLAASGGIRGAINAATLPKEKILDKEYREYRKRNWFTNVDEGLK